MRAASIHQRLVEVSDKQRVLYLHGTLGEGKSKQGAGVKWRVVMTCEVPAETISQ